MLVSEIIQRIQSLYSKGVQSDDSRLTSRHIYNKMISVRSRLITQEAKKRQKVNQWNYQTIPCIELIAATKYECSCLPNIGCEVLRTKYPLPKPLSTLNNHTIQSVTSLDGSVVYSEILFKELKYKAGLKYTKHKPDFWIQNGYLYLSYRNGPKALTVTMLAEDPMEVNNFPSYCDSECTDCQDCTSPLDTEFPIDNDMIETLVELCVNELVILFSKNLEDTTNDTRDSALNEGR